MAFTPNMTTTTSIDDSIVQEYEAEFIVQYNQTNVVDAACEYMADIGAKSIEFPRYSLLATAETPLGEDTDADSDEMVDSKVIFTPKEYGKSVTRTELADLQTGGRGTRGAMRLIGINMGETTNVLGTRALEASTNVKYGGDATGLADLDAADVMTPTLLNAIYNKLARANVPVHSATGTYIAYMHDDVIHDLREGSSAGSWEDVNKYNNEVPVLQNEVGMFKGFRIIRNNHCLLTSDGAGVASPQTLDAYTSSFLGFNGVGKAESAMPQIRVTGPFDKLGRFLNIGWYGVLEYKIVETNAVWNAVTSSSIGVNV